MRDQSCLFPKQFLRRFLGADPPLALSSYLPSLHTLLLNIAPLFVHIPAIDQPLFQHQTLDVK